MKKKNEKKIPVLFLPIQIFNPFFKEEKKVRKSIGMFTW